MANAFSILKGVIQGVTSTRLSGSRTFEPISDEELEREFGAGPSDSNLPSTPSVDKISDSYSQKVAQLVVSQLPPIGTTLSNRLIKNISHQDPEKAFTQVNQNFTLLAEEFVRVNQNFDKLNKSVQQIVASSTTANKQFSIALNKTIGEVNDSIKPVDEKFTRVGKVFDIFETRVKKLESLLEGKKEYESSTVNPLDQLTKEPTTTAAPAEQGSSLLGTAGATAIGAAAGLGVAAKATIRQRLTQVLSKLSTGRALKIILPYLPKLGLRGAASALLTATGIGSIVGVLMAASTVYLLYDLVNDLEEEANKPDEEKKQQPKSEVDQYVKPTTGGFTGGLLGIPSTKAPTNALPVTPAAGGGLVGGLMGIPGTQDASSVSKSGLTAGLLGIPSSQKPPTFATSYERAVVEQQKTQFMKFGQLPPGFEFLPGHMGRLGQPEAVAATGAMPLGGYAGFGGVPGAPTGGYGGGGDTGGDGAAPSTGGGPATGFGGTPGPGVNANAPSVGGLDRAKYQALFKGTPLEGHYETVIAAAQTHGLDPTLMAAVMAHETGRGKNVNYNNPAGLMDPKANWQRKIHFDTLEEGIMSAAKNMKKNFDRGGGTVEGMGKIYAPIGAANDPAGKNKHWPGGVRSFMDQLGTGGTSASGSGSTPNVNSSNTGFINTWEKYGKEKDLTPDSTSRKDLDQVTNIIAHDISAQPSIVKAVKELAKKEGISEAEAGYRLIPGVENEQVRKSYHITFDDKGWSLNRPLDKQAPHAADFNVSSIGLSHRGIEGVTPSDSAIKHGAYAAAYIMKKYPHLKLEDILTHPELGAKGTRSGGKAATEGSWREAVKAYIQENKLLDMSEEDLMGTGQQVTPQEQVTGAPKDMPERATEQYTREERPGYNVMPPVLPESLAPGQQVAPPQQPTTTTKDGSTQSVLGYSQVQPNETTLAPIDVPQQTPPTMEGLAEQRGLTESSEFGSSVTERQQVVAGIRKLPIKNELKGYLDYAAKKTGVQFEVTSGGQTRRGRRTGSHRHDVDNKGTPGAADGKLFVVENGKKRYLSVYNKNDLPLINDFVKHFASVTPGVGIGTNYMGSGADRGQLFHFGGANYAGGPPSLYAGRSYISEGFYQGLKLQGKEETVSAFQEYLKGNMTEVGVLPTQIDERSFFPVPLSKIAPESTAEILESMGKPQIEQPAVTLPPVEQIGIPRQGLAGGPSGITVRSETAPLPLEERGLAQFTHGIPEPPPPVQVTTPQPGMIGTPGGMSPRIDQDTGVPGVAIEKPMPETPAPPPNTLGIEGEAVQPGFAEVLPQEPAPPPAPPESPVESAIESGAAAGDEQLQGALKEKAASKESESGQKSGASSPNQGSNPPSNGGRNNPESQPAEPGSGGYGSFGRCFV